LKKNTGMVYFFWWHCHNSIFF